MPEEADDFFAERKSWSEVKLRIWENYVSTYLKIRGNNVPAVFIVDGFSGRGMYGGEEGERELGSPVLVVQEVDRRVARGIRAKIKCVFIEADADRCSQLRQAVTPFTNVDIEVRNHQFHREIPDLVDEMGTTSSLTFIDPFGVVDIPLEELRSLLSKPDSEFLINFNTPTLVRLAGSGRSSAATAPGKRRLLSRVLGDSESEPHWLSQWKGHDRDGQWTAWALRFYMSNLQEISPALRYIVAYPVRERYGSRPKYYLIFASRHLKAFEVMNDILCSEEDDIFTKSRGSGEQTSFFAEIRDDDRSRRLREHLDEQVHQYGCAHQACDVDAILQHFITVQFAEFKKKHYRDAVRDLERAGRASREGRGNDQTPIRFLGCSPSPQQ